jgi:hypothetical protein
MGMSGSTNGGTLDANYRWKWLSTVFVAVYGLECTCGALTQALPTDIERDMTSTQDITERFHRRLKQAIADSLTNAH